MHAVISFYLGAFEWMCCCLKGKKQQFILPRSILQWFSEMQPSALQAGAYGRQPSSSPAQSPDPAANLSSGLGNFWPVKNHPVHSSLRTLWLLWLVYCKFWLISNSNSQFQQGYFSSLKKKNNWLVFVLLIQIQSLLPIKTNTLWMF